MIWYENKSESRIALVDIMLCCSCQGLGPTKVWLETLLQRHRIVWGMRGGITFKLGAYLLKKCQIRVAECEIKL